MLSWAHLHSHMASGVLAWQKARRVILLGTRGRACWRPVQLPGTQLLLPRPHLLSGILRRPHVLRAVGWHSLLRAVGWQKLLRTAFRCSLLQGMGREGLLWAVSRQSLLLGAVRPEVLGSCLPGSWAALRTLQPRWAWLSPRCYTGSNPQSSHR